MTSYNGKEIGVIVMVLVGIAILTTKALFSAPIPETVLLPDISQLQSIIIQDDWVGLSPASPSKAKYILKNDTDSFSGTADFTVSKLAASKQITIPTDIIESFLGTLSNTSLESGEYRPTFTHTDDYPTIKIELIYGNGTIGFYTTSQGQYHSPWQVTFDKQSYVSKSNSPMQAFSILEPYLERNLLKEFQHKSTWEGLK